METLKLVFSDCQGCQTDSLSISAYGGIIDISFFAALNAPPQKKTKQTNKNKQTNKKQNKTTKNKTNKKHTKTNTRTKKTKKQKTTNK